IVLIGWPCVLLLLPFQEMLVSLVGLRGNVFFLPVCLLGARLKNHDVSRLAFGMVALNLFAALFAIAEFSFGIERFYPVSPVTSIIYASRDVGDYQYHRLPATFANAHSYSGTMVMTLPFLVGAWLQQGITVRGRAILLIGIASAFFGILVANARIHLVVGMM